MYCFDNEERIRNSLESDVDALTEVEFGTRYDWLETRQRSKQTVASGAFEAL